MPEIAISVIVPIYNAEEYLANCLASIEYQSLNNIEVICVDDASADSSAAIIKEFAEGDKRFRLYTFDTNSGAAAARNYATQQAHGEYLAFIDSDDWYPESTTLEKLYQAATDNNAAISGGSFSEYDSDTEAIVSTFNDSESLARNFTFNKPGIIDYRSWQGDYGYTRFLYKASLIEENSIVFPGYSRHEDPLFLVQAMLAAGKFYAIPDVVYCARTGHKSKFLSAAATEEALDAISKIIELSIQYDLPLLRQHQYELIKWYALDAPVYREYGSWKDIGSIVSRQAKESLLLRARKMNKRNKTDTKD